MLSCCHSNGHSPHGTQYTTRGGITVHRTIEAIPVTGAVEPLVEALDHQRGVLLASSYEYPGRYTRWDIGFVNPPLALTARGRTFELQALNARGQVLLPHLGEVLSAVPAVAGCAATAGAISGSIRPPEGRFAEEQRSRQPSVFSVLRTLIAALASDEDAHLGLYGAFGYDLAFGFEPLPLRLERQPDQPDLVLYLPDELIIVDHRRERAQRCRYDFEVPGRSTVGLPREGISAPYRGARQVERACDHARGEYANVVRKAKTYFKRGDLFEVVPGQTFYEPCPAPPSTVFRRLRSRNPAPYGFLMNLGAAEYLVGASPEMYVRVEGSRVETCPISGTIARGHDAMGDATQIARLLNSAKDEAELTMCTDVDRNDKSRICVPGSVRLLGRRQIEMYSRLIHTVDHVEGRLRPEFDALDAFLTHTWAVTVTGAPKAWAMRFIEEHEASARAWYGGAVGMLGFDGNINTGLTLRTIRIKDGVAQVRAGATLLHDSDPEEEERETHLKASALLTAIREPLGESSGEKALSNDVDNALHRSPAAGRGRRILLVDHQDSFVHTLANYLRQTGAEVVTVRAGRHNFDEHQPDLVVLSPGPGTPADFGVSATIAACIARGLAVFGVCLGLQGMVEHFGGQLGVLPQPVHGKPSLIRVCERTASGIFHGLPREFVAGRYHSLYAVREHLPACLRVTAASDDGVVMAVEHESLPLAAVQFHPESILSLEGDVGLRLIENVLRYVPEQCERMPN